MTNDNQARVDQSRVHLAKALAAFAQNPNPALSRSIAQLQRFIRRHDVTTWYVECTDTFGGEANYCWVRRFSVRAHTVRGASIVAARHLGYSGRIRKDYDSGDSARWNVSGAAVCFFVFWGDDSFPFAKDYPCVNAKGNE
jgi:hypothetical protein